MPMLRVGDTVRFVSPASPPDRAAIDRRAAILEDWGLRVEIAPHAFDRLSFLAGTDEDRLSDLVDAFAATHVRAIFATRGGKGSYRIAHRLPFAFIAAHRKALIGFSDITILQAVLWKRCNLVSVHGALTADAADRVSATAAVSLRTLLMEDRPIEIAADTAIPSHRLTTEGVATGPLVGGNLDMLATAAGWALPSMQGAVLLIESAGLGIGHLDRALTLLVRGDHLSGVAGIAVGHIADTPAHAPWSAIDILAQHLSPLGIPVLGGLPIGHAPDARSVPLGRVATLNATRTTLRIAGYA